MRLRGALTGSEPLYLSPARNGYRTTSSIDVIGFVLRISYYTCMLNGAVRKKQFASDDSDILIAVCKLNHLFQPGVLRNGVVVQKE